MTSIITNWNNKLEYATWWIRRFSLLSYSFQAFLQLFHRRCKYSLMNCSSQARSPCDDIVARHFRICTYTTKLSTPNLACLFNIYVRLNPVYTPCRGRSSDQEVEYATWWIRRFSLLSYSFQAFLQLFHRRCKYSLMNCSSQARSPCDDIVARHFRICTYTTKLSTPNLACLFNIYVRLNPVYTPCRGRSSDQEVQELAQNLTDRIASNSEACTSFTEHLDASSRHQLILALAASQPALSPSDKQKLDLLLQEHHVAPPYDQLSKWALTCYSIVRTSSVSLISSVTWVWFFLKVWQFTAWTWGTEPSDVGHVWFWEHLQSRHDQKSTQLPHQHDLGASRKKMLFAH